MSEEPARQSSGLLQSLKKLIFEDSPEPSVPESSVKSMPPSVETQPIRNVTINPNIDLNQNPTILPLTDVKQMKVKVLEILERLNEPGLDFFEVWNAAAQMGSVDASSIKAAYTSLKYVDKTLDKEKLVTSARKYADSLKTIIDKESSQKQLQKQSIEQNQVSEKANLIIEIESIERNIEQLQQQLNAKQKELKNINSKYEPQLKDIDHKIAIGNTAVTEVINDINTAISIIETNIN